MIIVVRCGPPPELFYGTLDNTVTLYGHTITYTCISGYKFADDASSKTITCQGTGPTWAPSSEIAAFNCTGECNDAVLKLRCFQSLHQMTPMINMCLYGL